MNLVVLCKVQLTGHFGLRHEVGVGERPQKGLADAVDTRGEHFFCQAPGKTGRSNK